MIFVYRKEKKNQFWSKSEAFLKCHGCSTIINFAWCCRFGLRFHNLVIVQIETNDFSWSWTWAVSDIYKTQRWKSYSIHLFIHSFRFRTSILLIQTNRFEKLTGDDIVAVIQFSCPGTGHTFATTNIFNIDFSSQFLVFRTHFWGWTSGWRIGCHTTRCIFVRVCARFNHYSAAIAIINVICWTNSYCQVELK